MCYIPAESIPYFDAGFQTVLSSELYDYYTGMWLTASSAYDDTERGENHYLHTVSWNGTDYEIEFFYSTQWEDTADGGRLFTKSYNRLCARGLRRPDLRRRAAARHL